MPNIDELTIELTASSQGIDGALKALESKLQRLKGLFNTDISSNLSQSIKDASTSIRTFSDAVNSIDDTKLKNMSKAMSQLARSSKKLSDVGKGIQNITTKAGKASDALKEMGNIEPDKKNFVISLLDAIERTDKEARSLRKSLREAIPEDLKIPKGFYSEMGDAETAKSLRGIIGIKNHGYSDASSYDYGKVLREALIANNITNTGTDDLLVNIQTLGETLQNLNNTIDITGRAIDRLTSSNNVSDVFDSVKDIKSDFHDLITDTNPAYYAEEYERLSNSFNDVAQSVDNIPTNTLEVLADSLRTLSDVNITADQMGGVTALARSIGKLSGSGAETASTSIAKITEGLQSLKGVTVPQLEGIDVLSSQLRSLGSKNIGRAATSLAPVAEGLEKLKAVGDIPSMIGLEQLGQSLSVFGRKTAQTAVTTIPQLATAFKQLITTLSSAPSVSQNTIDLANAMAALAAQGGKAGSAVAALSPKLKSFSSAASKTSKKSFSLAAAFGKIYATYWLLFRAFGKIREAIGFASDLTEVQNVVDTVFGDAKTKVEDFADSAITAFGISELSAKQFASRYQAMGSAMGITNAQVASGNEFLSGALDGAKRKVEGVTDSYENLGDSMADMSINLTKLSADIASFYNKDFAEVADDMQSVFTGMARPLREYGLDLTQATLKEWAMQNGLNANIEAMSQAEKTMLRYQYVMANMGQAMNDYAITANSWANVTRTIAEQFKKLGGIIGSGFINMFRPVLIKFRDFMNTLIDLVEKGMNAIGKLLGWKIEISDVGIAFDDASEGVGDFGDAAGGAADKAKELNKQIRNWDKLNVISMNDGGSGGGGGGGGGASGGGGGASKALDSAVRFEPYESDIESWYELGSKIGEKLKDGLDSIDWESIYDSARNFGTNFASFLNGLISPGLFYSVGRTIAGALNTAIYATLSFAQEFDFANYGKSFAARLNGFFENFDWYSAGLNLGTWISGFGTFIKNALLTMNWSAVFDGLWEGMRGFLDGLNEDAILGFIGIGLLTGVAQKIGKALLAGLFGKEGILSLGKLTLGIEGIEGLDGIATLFSGIGDGIGSFASSIAPVAGVIGGIVLAVTSLVESFGGFSGLLDELKGRIAPIIEHFKKVAESLDFSEKLNGLKEAFSGLGGAIARLFDSLGSFKGVWEVVLDVLQTVGIVIGNTIMPLLSGLALALSGVVLFIQGLVDVIAGLVNIVGGLLSSIASVVRAVVGIFTGDLAMAQEAFEDFTTGFENVWKGIQETVGGIIESFVGMGKAIASGVETLVNTVIGFFEGLKYALIGDPIVLDLVDGVINAFKDMVKTVVKKVQDFYKSVVQLFENIKKAVTDKVKSLVDTVKKKWTEFKSSVESITGQLKTSVIAKWTEIKTFISSVADGIKTYVSTKWNELKTAIETTANNIKTAVSGKWEELKTAIGTTISGIQTNAETVFNNISTNVGNIIGGLKTNIDNIFSSMKSSIESIVDGIGRSISQKWDGIVSTFKTKVDALKNALKFEWSLPKIKMPHFTWSSSGGGSASGAVAEILKTLGLPTSLPKLSVSWYKKGGFLDAPKQYSLMGMGENGIPEMLGTVGGKSAVAGGEEITGIREAINETAQREMALMREEIALLKQMVAKDFSVSSRDVFNATRTEAMNYTRRTGNPAFGF